MGIIRKKCLIILIVFSYIIIIVDQDFRKGSMLEDNIKSLNHFMKIIMRRFGMMYTKNRQKEFIKEDNEKRINI